MGYTVHRVAKSQTELSSLTWVNEFSWVSSMYTGGRHVIKLLLTFLLFICLLS